ncbi:hypothetical protein OF846_000370 [Rhodotorula toruloides]|nr:hypothetical protein OF846_000370 [Rhodotorula toruloides]
MTDRRKAADEPPSSPIVASPLAPLLPALSSFLPSVDSGPRWPTFFSTSSGLSSTACSHPSPPPERSSQQNVEQHVVPARHLVVAKKRGGIRFLRRKRLRVRSGGRREVVREGEGMER